MDQEKVVNAFGVLSIIAGQLASAGNPNATVNGMEGVVLNQQWLQHAGQLIIASVSELTKQVFGYDQTAEPAGGGD